MWTHALTGLLAGLALIVAIGAQNAFVLRQGVRREHVGLVVLVCLLSDAVLIAAGTAGVGVLVTAVPWLLEALRWGPCCGSPLSATVLACWPRPSPARPPGGCSTA